MLLILLPASIIALLLQVSLHFCYQYHYTFVLLGWGIGSHIDQQSLFYDVFPLTDITNGKSVHIDRNTFYINDSPHSNVSDILALSDGVNPSEIDGFYIEPGRIFYHVVEFCDLAHSCIQSSPRESISIRE